MRTLLILAGLSIAAVAGGVRRHASGYNYQHGQELVLLIGT